VVLTSGPKNTPDPPISSEMKIISQTRLRIGSKSATRSRIHSPGASNRRADWQNRGRGSVSVPGPPDVPNQDHDDGGIGDEHQYLAYIRPVE